MLNAYEFGKQAFAEGKSLHDNPYTCGLTKLGNVKLTEEGIEWERGFLTAKPLRQASKEELLAANRVDVSRFRRKPNRFYHD